MRAMRLMRSLPGAETWRKLEGALGGSDCAFETRVGLDRHACRFRQRLVTGFHDVVRVAAVEVLDVNASARIHGESLEPFLEQLRIHFAELRTLQFNAPD